MSMAFLLCCRGPRFHSPTYVPPDSERLRTLQPASVVSIVLPSDTVPHRPTTGIDEYQALRDIFGASPSSHRGYQAAAKSSDSFDANFKFGNESPTKSRARGQRSLDKLGLNIRQRLSQSKLSIHSSRKSMKDVKSTETVIHTKMLVPENQTSTGLDDILVSRTVSQGGYDSDATGIRTPSWTKVSAGSILVSPEYTAKVLNAFDVSPSKRSASPPRTPSSKGGYGHTPPAVSRCPSTTPKGQEGLGTRTHVQEGGRQIRVRATSTPRKPVTPQRESFSALLQLRPQESPTDVLRRLSVGLANGTIKLPDTPELKAMRMPSIVEAMPEWRLSFAAPKRASSLHRGDLEVRQALKTLSDRVEKVKRDSTASDWTSSDKHVSLLSSLDPALLQYISQYGDDEHHEQLHKRIDHVREVDKSGNLEEPFELDTMSHTDTSGLHDNTSVREKLTDHKTDASSSGEHSQRCVAGLESEKESVHLFDMRISQRLASTSVLPTLSPTSTNLGSNQHYMDRSSQSFSKLDRFPTFIGRTSAEHLRRPSDPRTKRLFEPDSGVDGRKLHPKWTSAMSMGTSYPKKPAHKAEVDRDDASSVYMSEAGPEDSDVKSVVSRRARSSSRPTPNSIAIAGRQGIPGLPSEQRRNSMGQMLSPNSRNKVGLARSVSDVRVKESKFSEDLDIPKKQMRDNLSSEGTDTLANESMSMVDFLTTTDPRVDRNERMSEIEFARALNERLRFSIGRPCEKDAGRDKYLSETSHGGISNGPIAEDNLTDEPIRLSPRGRDECATTLWERALRTARADPSLGSSGESFGSSFGQLQRDQSHVQRLGINRPSHEHTIGGISTLPARQSRSLSPDRGVPSRHLRESFNLDRHQSLCVEARKPLTRSTSPARSLKTKKKSLLDINRFTTLGRHNNNNNNNNNSSNKMAKSSPATVSPARDFLAWARFPSHTRLERNGAAVEKDGVLTRDFSPPTDAETASSRNRSKLSLMTQPDNMGVHTPGSWRFLKFGHARKKSRSMNFAVSGSGQMEKEKEKAKKRPSMLALTLPLAKWKRLYRSHSSDLRRFRAGHRSSISKGGKVEYPELEIVPGYDGGNGGRVRMEELGDFEREQRRWLKERGRERSKGRFGGTPEVDKEGPAMTKMDHEPERCTKTRSSSFSEATEERTPTKHRAGAAAEAGNTWANIYQACVVKDDNDEEDSDPRPLDSSARLLPRSSESTTPPHHAGRHVFSASHDHEGEDSYISCSVGLSDDTTPDFHRSTGSDDAVGARGGSSASADRLLADSGGKGGGRRYDGPMGAGMELKLERLVSPELRDSTVDFRIQLEGEERRVREELLGRREVSGG